MRCGLSGIDPVFNITYIEPRFNVKLGVAAPTQIENTDEGRTSWRIGRRERREAVVALRCLAISGALQR
jgi:hypothetical protein